MRIMFRIVGTGKCVHTRTNDDNDQQQQTTFRSQLVDLCFLSVFVYLPSGGDDDDAVHEKPASLLLHREIFLCHM